MNTLAIDTSEARGSIALLRGEEALATQRHESTEDYSQWLLPAVDYILGESKIKMGQLDLLAVSTGPGSFTGVRVGLTAVKAWAEVYGKPVVGVSRLEALARSQRTHDPFVAACYDAQRGQIFAALYHSASGRLTRCEDEMVIPAEDFLRLVGEGAGSNPVTWLSLDGELITGLSAWKTRSERGDTMHSIVPELATAIGRLAQERAREGAFSDALTLDANYVRRSDAEIFWKGR